MRLQLQLLINLMFDLTKLLLTISGSLLLSDGLLGALDFRVQSVDGLDAGAALVAAAMDLFAAVELVGDE